MPTDAPLAQRLHSLRKARQLTLEQLAERSGVSRSAISLIEREQSSPTAAVLDKLADALGLTLAQLFNDDTRTRDGRPLARHAEQAEWTDPESGYVRRHLSPPACTSPLELAELRFPARARVRFDSPARQVCTHQQLWLLSGVMEITVGEQVWRLQAGDCLALVLDRPITFHNPGRKEARYLLAMSTLPATWSLA